MRNYADGKQLKKIEKRLMKVIKKEYPVDGMFLEVDKVEIYMADGPVLSMEVRYGRFKNDNTTDWQRVVELPLTDGNLDFLAGQFYQRMYDWEQGLLEE